MCRWFDSGLGHILFVHAHFSLKSFTLSKEKWLTSEERIPKIGAQLRDRMGQATSDAGGTAVIGG